MSAATEQSWETWAFTPIVTPDCIAGFNVCPRPGTSRLLALCENGHLRSGPVCRVHAAMRLQCRVCLDAGQHSLLRSHG